jgi:hypothetical protein
VKSFRRDLRELAPEERAHKEGIPFVSVPVEILEFQ